MASVAYEGQKGPSHTFYSDIEVSLASLRTCLSNFPDSYETSLTKSDIDKKLGEMSGWIEKQKQSAEETSQKELIQNVGKVVTATASGVQKLVAGDTVGGTLEIVSSVATFGGAMIGGPAGAAVGTVISTLCSIIGAIFTACKPRQPSIVAQLADVVHRELVNFNDRLQDQKYNGLKRRVADQGAQLYGMKPGEKLDDPDLWVDYAQFMGELSDRFESPLPFKYDETLTKDPDVNDCVRALMKYCQAYSCYMALLITAKGKFYELGPSPYKEEEDRVDRKISAQWKQAKEKLAFLSDEKYFTFLGRLPNEGGKLTKIVAVSRNAEARRLVKMVTHEFGLPAMLDSKTIESKAKLVSTATVKLKLARHPKQNVSGMQLINETKFPMRMVYPALKQRRTSIIQPRSSYEMMTMDYQSLLPVALSGPAATAAAGDMLLLKDRGMWGYMLIYLDGELREDDEPRAADVTRVIEFSISGKGLNLQDKTSSEFTKGEDTRKEKCDFKPKTIYWMTNGTHYLARAEDTLTSLSYYRFVVQDFDPINDGEFPTEKNACVVL